RLGAVEPCHALQKRGCCLLSLTNIDAGPAGRWCFLVLVVQETASNNPPTIQHLSNTKVQQTKGCREIVASKTIVADAFLRGGSASRIPRKNLLRGAPPDLRRSYGGRSRSMQPRSLDRSRQHHAPSDAATAPRPQRHL